MLQNILHDNDDDNDNDDNDDDSNLKNRFADRDSLQRFESCVQSRDSGW